MESAILLTAESLVALVDRWRRDSWVSLDPPLRLSEAVPPHITLIWPWHPQPTSQQALRRLREVTSATNPFDLRFRTVSRFDDDLVCLEPDPSDDLDRLFANLTAAFPEYPPYGGQFEEVILHMTLATQGGEPIAAAVRATNPDLRLTVENISTWRSSESGRWTLCDRVPLGQTPG